MHLLIDSWHDCEWVLWNILCIVNVSMIDVVGILMIVNEIVRHDTSLITVNTLASTSRCEDVETSLQDPE
jgi:hypothetical protein